MKKILIFLLIFSGLTKFCFSSPSNTMSLQYAPNPNESINSASYKNEENHQNSTFNSHNHTDVTQLGTITAGTWQGTVVDEQFGGIGGNFSSTAQGNIFYFSGTGTVAALGPGTSGYFLQTKGASANPVWASAHQNSRLLITTGNLTTTSTSFVDIDGSNIVITITTGANPVLIGFAANADNSVSGQRVDFDFTVDGTRQGGTVGLFSETSDTVTHPVSYVYQTAALTAASHTFRPQYKVTANTGTVYAGASIPLHFWVSEIVD